MIIPLDKSHKVITNKVFSSLTCVIPDFKKRYETQIKTSDECFKKIMKEKSEKAKAKYLRRLRKKEGIIETSVEELCVKENIKFKVARAESWNAIVLLDRNRTIYQNEQFSVGRQNVYIIGLKGLKNDNINIRILEHLNYYGDCYEARESINAKSLFYYTHPESYFQERIEQDPTSLLLHELDELDDEGKPCKQYYYQYQHHPNKPKEEEISWETKKPSKWKLINQPFMTYLFTKYATQETIDLINQNTDFDTRNAIIVNLDEYEE